jgi:DNA polymerase III delta' subunit
VDGARTRGHGPALEAIGAMLRGGVPHAVLISGPAGVGKTTLALDLAAGLLCVAPDVAARPCRACRGCRLVASGDHPDLHWLRPQGPGGQIVIGDPSDPAKARGVRDLLAELALMPMEGSARVAIIEAAHRMNEDAQGALLKTLEEPPSGVAIILCADEEGRLAPTIRSRCARIRLGAVGARDVETVLAQQGVVDPALASRLARLVGGRPGIALAYARAPDALRIRGELARVLLDLTAAGPGDRLAAMRAALPAAMRMVADLDTAMAVTDLSAPDATIGPRAGGRAAGRRSPASRNGPAARTGSPAAPPAPAAEAAEAAPPGDGEIDQEDPDDVGAGPKSPAAPQRRRAAEAIVLVWIDVARDLALVAAGGRRSVRDPDLLEELDRVSDALEPGAAAGALVGLERAATLLAANVSPELVLDAMVLGWPRRRRAA